jgi:hypothetical protein
MAVGLYLLDTVVAIIGPVPQFPGFPEAPQGLDLLGSVVDPEDVDIAAGQQLPFCLLKRIKRYIAGPEETPERSNCMTFLETTGYIVG